MNGLVEQVEESIRRRTLFRHGQPILVAVSGGVDSMVLLEVLERLSRQEQNGWRLVVAHFNHALRGEESNGDEELVREQARRMRLKCEVGRGDVKGRAREGKLSLEMAARGMRHEFLARTALRLSMSVVALAHHADDRVELFFLRLFRGAGGEGLAGMKWAGPSPGDRRVELVRPLFEQSRESIRAFAERADVAFREDSSNGNLEVLRNRIRHSLLPLMIKEYQPALRNVVLREMEILAGESEHVAESARSWLEEGIGGGFSALGVGVQRRCLELQLVGMGIRPEFDLIERLRGPAEGPVMVNPGLRLRRDNQGRVQNVPGEEEGFAGGELRVDLRGEEGRAEFDELSLRWRVESGGKRPLRAKQGWEWFDADKIGREVLLRHWRRGDKFRPIGMSHSVKLQDLFTNAKVPQRERHQRVVAETGAGEIWWVEGLRISEKFKLGPETARRLCWRWERSRRMK